jgi:D-amino-acid oxidase
MSIYQFRTLKLITISRAGVLGLTCAFKILKQYPRRRGRVFIVGDYIPKGVSDVGVPSDFSSHWGGAHFRPFPIRNTSVQNDTHRNLTQYGYRRFKELVGIPGSSVSMVDAVEFTDEHTSLIGLEDWRDCEYLDDFKALRQGDQPHLPQLRGGISYRTWVLHPPSYLEYLRNQIMQMGGVFQVTQSFRSLRQAVQLCSEQFMRRFKVVVNATGIGFSDTKCYPAKCHFMYTPMPPGQTISHHKSNGQIFATIPLGTSGRGYMGARFEPGIM